MQLPGDSRTLAFLRMQEAATQIAKPLVAFSKLLLTGEKVAFGTAPAPALNEQSCDERGLKEENTDCAERRALAASYPAELGLRCIPEFI